VVLTFFSFLVLSFIVFVYLERNGVGYLPCTADAYFGWQPRLKSFFLSSSKGSERMLRRLAICREAEKFKLHTPEKTALSTEMFAEEIFAETKNIL